MDKFGSWTNQASTIFETSGDNLPVTLTPAANIPGATLTLTLPIPSGVATTDTLVSLTSVDTLTGKSISGSTNTFSAIPVNTLVALTASRATVTDGSGFVSAATTTATEIGYVNGVTSALQTQIDGKQTDVVTTEGDTIVGSVGNAAARLAIGGNGTVLTSNGTTASWQATGGGDVSSSANITDHTLVRGDGGAKNVQDSSIVIDDSDNMSAIGTISAGSVTTSGDFIASLGAVGTPSHTFTGDLTTGMFSTGAASLNFATGGAERIAISSTEVVFNETPTDTDFRVETNNFPYALFVNAGVNSVSMGQAGASTTNVLHVETTGGSKTHKIIMAGEPVSGATALASSLSAVGLLETTGTTVAASTNLVHRVGTNASGHGLVVVSCITDGETEIFIKTAGSVTTVSGSLTNSTTSVASSDGTNNAINIFNNSGAIRAYQVLYFGS